MSDVPKENPTQPSPTKADAASPSVEKAVTVDAPVMQRIEANLVAPGSPAPLAPVDDVNRMMADAKVLQEVAKANDVLASKIEKETGEHIIITNRIVEKGDSSTQ